MRPLRLVALLGVLPLASCGDSTSAPVATTIEMSVSALAFDAVGDMVTVTATVLDQKGAPMIDAFPTWSSNATGVAIVNGAGQVTATGSGSATVTATRGSAQATVTVTVDQTPTTFTYAAGANGNDVSAVRGQPVPIRPAVRVLDPNGMGIPGEVVTFAVVSGGGSAPAATAVTDASGVARVQSWTLGPDLGVNTMQATYGGFDPVLFTVTGIEDPCTPAGATVLAVGATLQEVLATTDCLASDLKRYDLYKIELGAPSGIVIEMTASHDAYLILLASDNATVLKEVDDIVLGVITDSRLAIALAAGTYYVRATSFLAGETGTYSISARTAAVGVPASVVLNGGNGQVATPNSTLPVAPSVLVLDDIGDPVPNAAVTFATVPGIGSATGVDAVTDANGVATVGSWTIAAGANVLSASVAGSGIIGNPAIFSAAGSANPSGFNISLRFLSIPSAGQLQAFSDATVRWESIITGDIPSITVAPTGPVCPDAPLLDETVDDLLIFVRLEPRDGPGGVLGAAGPCIVRLTDRLPIVGLMEFDTADLDLATLPNIILHEMGHVLGFGTIWSQKLLLLNPSLPNSLGADTHFPGPNAVAAFNAAGGNTYVGAKVPVENTQGGAGTRDSHWRESQLKNELMTGFLGAGANPLSAITIRSMQDLGYTVSVATADPYTFVPSIMTGPTADGPTVHLRNDILAHPVRVYIPPVRRSKGKPGVR